MNYFVFRNMTIERLFDSLNANYSGYQDISDVPNADRYIWCYMTPYKADICKVAEEVDSYSAMLTMLLARLQSSSMVIAFTLENIFSVSLTVVDPLQLAINRYNSRLYDLSTQYTNLKIVDFGDFLKTYSASQWVDWKYYFISQIPINPKLAKDFTAWFNRKIQAIELNRKKCLVLDLDNTLWGGVLGEDGILGVKLGLDYPGNAYLAFQQYILALADQGVILTVCSKNNLEDVRTFWQNHPFNLIREEHLAAYRINWNNKADNIREIARELNIGLDSMVFIDDNPSERELIKGMLPEVSVVEFPSQPYLLPNLIYFVADRYFQIYSLTKEDVFKTEQYKKNALREREKERFSNFEEYLRSLQLELTITEAQLLMVDRIAQMTQKTNQFNLTTKRYTTSDIQEFMNHGDWVETLAVRDRFGDNGVTGLLIAVRKGECAEIDTLLMSCRILGKGIETEFVTYVMSRIFASGISVIQATYVPTSKNAQVSDFYDRLGFENLGGGIYQITKENFNYVANNLYIIHQ